MRLGRKKHHTASLAATRPEDIFVSPRGTESFRPDPPPGAFTTPSSVPQEPLQSYQVTPMAQGQRGGTAKHSKSRDPEAPGGRAA
ncbi:hypothetical protein I79_017058 [Cricetulus griseus]|uniref:Uncharacterized protein n=1 Tax=Cricetulus griseus TaxID=10029 RepID=G3I115_CRIGR|nr:hypothetical protein I79_017058 [Cricetulus griseus]